MDRSRVLQQLQESQARLAKAEAELAEAAGKLRAWSEAGNHGPLDTGLTWWTSTFFSLYGGSDTPALRLTRG